MTPIHTITLLRVLFVTFCFFIGTQTGEVLFGSLWTGGLAGLCFGLVFVLVDRLLKGFSLRTFSAATFGALLGLVFARLLLASNILHHASDEMQWVCGLLVYAVFGYIGMMLAIRSNRDEFSLVIPYIRFQRTGIDDAPVIVDTNIIIDGRLSAICATGFLSSSLIVPRFVLDELQRLADSAEPIKRERGRHGLDALKELRDNPKLTVSIHESVADGETAVDARLIQLARLLRARLLTNDSNLSKVARLQNVSVLSPNEIAKVLRPAVSSGEAISLSLVKEGREAHQAVGYLADGTMIVVNHARAHLGTTVNVTIGSVLHTAAGQMYFAELQKN